MIQDDYRENLLISLLNLQSSPFRNGWDAKDEFGNLYELKSTTKNTVSTARDISFSTLESWKNKIWIIGRGSILENSFVYNKIYFLSPDKMNIWYEKIKNKLEKDMKIVTEACNLTDVFFDDIYDRNRVKEILQKGIRINNPAISWKFVEDNGIKIEEKYSENLRFILGQMA